MFQVLQNMVKQDPDVRPTSVRYLGREGKQGACSFQLNAKHSRLAKEAGRGPAQDHERDTFQSGATSSVADWV